MIRVDCKCLCALSVMLMVFPVVGVAENLCGNLLSSAQVAKVYKQNAINQLALEFGMEGSFVYEIEQSLVDKLLVRIESYARYQKPGQKELARMRLKAWVSRCNGTTIIRGNTWLSDGSLQVVRYSQQELTGRGLLWGNKNAALKFIVYVDSRCPHCHRLLDYAKKLVDEGKVYLDIRQVAYLEDKEQAVLDTQLSKSGLIKKNNVEVDDKQYLEMLGGLASEEALSTSSLDYRAALQFITENTLTAEKVLNIITVPGVLIQEKAHDNRYRKMGYWEINRIFQ